MRLVRVHTIILRDTASASSTREAKPTKRNLSSVDTATLPAPVAAQPLHVASAVPFCSKRAPSAKARKLAHTRAAQCHFEQQKETAFWASFTERFGKRLAPSQGKPTAKDRIETIERRLLARDPDVVT